MYKTIIGLIIAGGILLAGSRPEKAVYLDKGQNNVVIQKTGKTELLQNSFTTYHRPAYNGVRDYQVNGPTPTRLWTTDNGIFVAYFEPGPLVWLYYDFATSTWYPTYGSVAPDTAFWPFTLAGYGNMFINFNDESASYLYPFFTGHSYTTPDYPSITWWPKSPFDPTTFVGDSVNYEYMPGEQTLEVWPRVAITGDTTFLHWIATDYASTGGIFYNRLRALDDPGRFWDGTVLLVSDDVGPWYNLNADPFGTKVVIWYYDPNTKGILLVDENQGADFYAGTYGTINLSDSLFAEGEIRCYYEFVNSGLPFVDRDGRIHYMMPATDGSHVAPVFMYHYYEGREPDFVFLDTIKAVGVPSDTLIYYGVHINATLAGRTQMAQNRNNGVIYAIWEEFIQESGNFVQGWKGNGADPDTFAPTRIMLWRSTDVGGEYSTWEEVGTLIQSGNNATFPGAESYWYRYPLISPFVSQKADTDLVVWGVYEDFNPGFEWQGYDPSEVDLVVGITKVWPTGVSEKPAFKTEFVRLSEVARYFKGGNIEFSVNIPGTRKVDVKLYDVSGKLVKGLYNGTASGELKLRIGELPAGNYFIKVTSGKETLLRKILVTK